MDRNKIKNDVENIFLLDVMLFFTTMWLVGFPLLIAFVRYNLAATISMKDEAIKFYWSSFVLVIIGFGWVPLRGMIDDERLYSAWTTMTNIIILILVFGTPIPYEGKEIRLFEYYLYDISNQTYMHFFIINTLLLIINNLYLYHRNFLFTQFSLVQSFLNIILTFMLGFSIERILGYFGIFFISVAILLTIAVMLPEIGLLEQVDKENRYWWLTGRKNDR
jgi:hypothetical protein